MVISSAQVHKEEGRVAGRVAGRADALQELLEFRFGPLPQHVAPKVRALPPSRLSALMKKVLTAQSVADLHLE